MTEITTTKSFQERMFERVRDQMGDLLTDDDMKKIVDTAVNKAFFEERPSGSYHAGPKPSVFVEMMHEELKMRVHSALDQWLKDNPEVVAKTIEKVVQDGITKAVITTLENRMSWPLQQFADQLRSKGVFN